MKEVAGEAPSGTSVRCEGGMKSEACSTPMALDNDSLWLNGEWEWVRIVGGGEGSLSCFAVFVSR